MRVSVKIEGGPELIKKLEQMGVDVDRVVEAAATAGAQVIADDANPRAPEPLIATETSERGRGHATVDIGPPDEKWDWKFLETGAQPHTITGSPLVFMGREGLVRVFGVSHPGMAARPFLRPAFDSKKDAATDEVGSVIKKRALR